MTLRSVRESVDREGSHLYPACPYDHCTKTKDGHLAALHAFLTTRQAVRHEAPKPAGPSR